MSAGVFIVVVGAALLHATWNALVKGGADPRMNMGAVVLGHVPSSRKPLELTVDLGDHTRTVLAVPEQPVPNGARAG